MYGGIKNKFSQMLLKLLQHFVTMYARDWELSNATIGDFFLPAMKQVTLVSLGLESLALPFLSKVHAMGNVSDTSKQ